MMIRKEYLIALLLIFVAAFSRVLPHPMNFTPVAAIALFGGVYFNRKFALVVPLAALVISDYFLGFYSEIIFVYVGFALTGVIGLWIQKRKSTATIIGGTLVSAVLFFIITNFGSWLVMPDVYTRSFDGLAACYIAAIPFFRNSLAGDVLYVAVLFGMYELAVKYIVHRELAEI